VFDSIRRSVSKIGIAIPGYRTVFQSRNPGIMRDQIPGSNQIKFIKAQGISGFENNVYNVIITCECMHITK